MRDWLTAVAAAIILGACGGGPGLPDPETRQIDYRHDNGQPGSVTLKAASTLQDDIRLPTGSVIQLRADGSVQMVLIAEPIVLGDLKLPADTELHWHRGRLHHIETRATMILDEATLPAGTALWLDAAFRPFRMLVQTETTLGGVTLKAGEVASVDPVTLTLGTPSPYHRGRTGIHTTMTAAGEFGAARVDPLAAQTDSFTFTGRGRLSLSVADGFLWAYVDGGAIWRLHDPYFGIVPEFGAAIGSSAVLFSYGVRGALRLERTGPLYGIGGYIGWWPANMMLVPIPGGPVLNSWRRRNTDAHFGYHPYLQFIVFPQDGSWSLDFGIMLGFHIGNVDGSVWPPPVGP